MIRLIHCLLIYIHLPFISQSRNFLKDIWNEYDEKYSYFSERERLEMLEETKKMFQFGYDNYMQYAFPQDELNPIYCEGRGPDKENPSNININDVLGDYMLTLVDTLDTLAIMGNCTEFKAAVKLVIDNLSFDKPNTVQVFESTIRIMGALLSAHLLIKDPYKSFGDISPPEYDDELLTLAHDIASRLLPAFENTSTGIPYPRVNLRHGVPKDCVNETCTAGAGSLVLEFGILSRLLGDPTYESLARQAVNKLWKYKSNVTGLLGNVINIQTGEWIGIMSGLGAGMDSFYEYLLKTYILFGEKNDLKMFTELYDTVKYNMRRGRTQCNNGTGNPPIYVNVNMKTGDTLNNWVDSLQAAFSAVQVLIGDIEEAICSHAMFYSIWRKYGVLPERYNWNLKAPDVKFYPLRPEFVESTYFLYQATKNPFYLHVGRDIVNSLNKHARTVCGYGTIHNVFKKDLEDRMESFFLSETCKYLYLLFDKDNHVNKNGDKYLFSTEGHIFPMDKKFRANISEMDYSEKKPERRKHDDQSVPTIVDVRGTNSSCNNIPKEREYFLPIKSRYFEQMDLAIGLND